MLKRLLIVICVPALCFGLPYFVGVEAIKIAKYRYANGFRDDMTEDLAVGGLTDAPLLAGWIFSFFLFIALFILWRVYLYVRYGSVVEEHPRPY